MLEWSGFVSEFHPIVLIMSLLYVDDVIRASSWSGTCSLPGHIEKEVVMGLLWRPLVPVSRWSGACFTTSPSGKKSSSAHCGCICKLRFVNCDLPGPAAAVSRGRRSILVLLRASPPCGTASKPSSAQFCCSWFQTSGPGGASPPSRTTRKSPSVRCDRSCEQKKYNSRCSLLPLVLRHRASYA